MHPFMAAISRLSKHSSFRKEKNNTAAIIIRIENLILNAVRSYKLLKQYKFFNKIPLVIICFNDITVFLFG